MRSCLYECRVMHQRFAPTAHRFVYNIFYFAIDLDELGALPRKLALFSVNRRNAYSFREDDFLPTGEAVHNATVETGAGPSTLLRAGRWRPDGRSSGLPLRVPHLRPWSGPTSTSGGLKERVVAYLGERGVDLAEGRVVLVTLPRVFGYPFNPVSFYFCYDREDNPVAALAEVTNTFREMKTYFLGPGTLGTGWLEKTRGETFHLRIPKHFYVSPYSDVDVAFDFNLSPPGPRLSAQIDDYTGGQRTLTSSVTGTRRGLTGARLAWWTLKYPLITVRIITLIHWQALLLRLKRTPWFAKAARAGDQSDLYRPHASIAASAPSDPT